MHIMHLWNSCFFFCGTHQNFIIQGPLSDISSQDDIVMLYKRGITLNAIVQHFISCFMSELDPDIMVKDTWIPVGHLMFFPFVYIVTTSNFNTKILQLKTRQREIFIRLLIMYNSLKAYSCIHVHTLMKVYHLFYLNSTLDVWRLKSRWDNLILIQEQLLPGKIFWPTNNCILNIRKLN